ncbi:hypothetical protein OOT46_29670 [Aquabacterium sp. A7-Y]|uniref:hypothetical protein n=1 Tax=Aquabacterium sp. A7-Y TaxID=1349605 RepID=UPI00223D7E3C|nr:hypothetical protein [Aquabacterium sp. A7-Y]MCW7541971.1 hypothetical protein [Aquabacterium sp. A7-Y]
MGLGDPRVARQDRVAFFRVADSAVGTRGRDLAATTREERIPERPSSLSVIRLSDDEGRAAEHRRLHSVETDASAEGLAVCPDGRLVATVNRRGTAFPAGSPRHQREASVTLLRFDPASGTLIKLQDHRFEGVLPEGGSFDLSGRHFVATVFRVNDGEPPTLRRLGRIPLPQGAHPVQMAHWHRARLLRTAGPAGIGPVHWLWMTRVRTRSRLFCLPAGL